MMYVGIIGKLQKNVNKLIKQFELTLLRAICYQWIHDASGATKRQERIGSDTGRACEKTRQHSDDGDPLRIRHASDSADRGRRHQAATVYACCADARCCGGWSSDRAGAASRVGRNSPVNGPEGKRLCSSHQRGLNDRGGHSAWRFGRCSEADRGAQWANDRRVCQWRNDDQKILSTGAPY